MNKQKVSILLSRIGADLLTLSSLLSEEDGVIGLPPVPPTIPPEAIDAMADLKMGELQERIEARMEELRHPPQLLPNGKRKQVRRPPTEKVNGGANSVLEYLKMAEEERRFWVPLKEIASAIYPPHLLDRIRPRIRYLHQQGKILVSNPGEQARLSMESRVALDVSKEPRGK
jgi:hypothetical protein